MAQRIIRRPEVESRTGQATSTLYYRMARGEFPRPVQLGPNSVGWREEDVDDWIAARPAAPGRRSDTEAA